MSSLQRTIHEYYLALLTLFTVNNNYLPLIKLNIVNNNNNNNNNNNIPLIKLFILNNNNNNNLPLIKTLTVDRIIYR